jgi:hypothetical protein
MGQSRGRHRKDRSYSLKPLWWALTIGAAAVGVFFIPADTVMDTLMTPQKIVGSELAVPHGPEPTTTDRVKQFLDEIDREKLNISPSTAVTLGEAACVYRGDEYRLTVAATRKKIAELPSHLTPLQDARLVDLADRYLCTNGN